MSHGPLFVAPVGEKGVLGWGDYASHKWVSEELGKIREEMNILNEFKEQRRSGGVQVSCGKM